MFRVRSEPLLLSEAGIHGLCVSLNTPVLNIEELPVGPARASIMVFESGYGTFGLGVGVRAIETSQAIVFSFEGTIDMSSTPAEALEQAATFAERMGFLFDDDVVAGAGSEGRSRALGLWADLTGFHEPELDDAHELDEIAPPPLSPAVRLEPEPEELVLDDLAELANATALQQAEADEPQPEPSPPAAAAAEMWLDDLSESAPVPAEPVAPDPSAVPVCSQPAAVPLSKFRQRATPLRDPAQRAETPEPEESSGRSSLGRVALVRRRPDGSEQAARPALLLRLLGSF